ncbi:MAG: ABC transporter permease [Clostridia bacterium]|nr:ABC transporter permease [Clostridia bacterium]MDE7181853.1 ABC transporter permease [Clostridia bacterium]
MKKAWRICWLALILLFIYVPVLVLAVYSFTDASMVGGNIGGFSFENYANLFKNEDLRSMILGTLLLAVVCAVIATVLATLGAIGSFYSKKLPKTLLHNANQVPVVNADIVTGFSICILLIVILRVNKDTFIPLGIGHVVLCAPFVYLSILPKLKQMDNSLYEAALDLGATPAQALFKVVIPQLIPGILSGFMLAVTLSLDDYFITTYTKPSTFDTISTYVVNATKGSQTEVKTALWALSTLIFLIVVVIVVLMNVLSGRKKEARK